MTERQRHTAQQMLASMHAVLEEMAQMSREDLKRSGEAQWRIMQALVGVAIGAAELAWLLVLYPDPWWRKSQRLGYRARYGRFRVDFAYLWDALPRNWPRLEEKLIQLLDDNPEPPPHG